MRRYIHISIFGLYALPLSSDVTSSEELYLVQQYIRECLSEQAKYVFQRLIVTIAWILYNLSPYDKSFWQCLHNPWYLILISVGLFPSLGVIWWFFLFMLHDKRDEFQICQFIVGFQTAKFFSQGWFSLIKGALLYYLCALKEQPSCAEEGPMLNGTLDASLFIFQIILVWLTFFILPYTQPCSDVQDARDAYLIAFEKRNDLNRAALQAKVRLGRGGRLMNLFWWETFTVILGMLQLIRIYRLEYRC